MHVHKLDIYICG